ncbi:DNA replication/repair protein RecF [Metallumcola ferriviriculae]|uniref:DNA replication and repair protein RecF n=1 Tax=Metallumcola ferriviriculae TaxID=3039180 RepID=A0AAU0UK45_9FIRM|nr:DNA replication/repair protein RecF [Desulfitibacteraceae bacterium MK1]
MLVKDLLLKNFRNYNLIKLEWHNKINIIVGNNAQGKSNILEAINILGTGKSHRTNKDIDLIRWDQSDALIKAMIHNNNIDYEAEVILKEGKKEFFINNNKLQKNNMVSTYFNTVLFCPEDLMLVKGGPRERRQFLDNEISQVSPQYNSILADFKRVLLQRNNNLKRGLKGEQFDVWTNQLIHLGSQLIKKRLDTIEKLKPLSRLVCRKITNGFENLELKYVSSVKNIGFDVSLSVLKEMYIQSLKEKNNEEYYQGITLVGPHRDDMIITINGIDIRSFGSQGQQRTAALALKLSELEYIKSEIGEYPILLLDDVFSELDNHRKTFLMDKVIDRIQTFITGTDLSGLTKELTDQGIIYKVDNGSVNF